MANNTTVTGGGLQRVNAGGSVSDTVISAGGGLSGFSSHTPIFPSGASPINRYRR
nr:autotransporter adhesin family protein [Escherichia coli]